MIRIRSCDLENIITHCLEENPIEACGVLAGYIKDPSGRIEKNVKKVYRCRNELKSSVEYRIEAEEQFKIFSKIEDSSLDLLGFYHSHPSTRSEPSTIDRERANYCGCSYVIVSLHPTKVSSWVLAKTGVFAEEDICIGE